MPFWFLLIWIIVCSLGIFNPRLAWYLSEGWKFRDAEPSDAYLAWSRIGGVIFLIIGLVAYANTR